MATRKEAGPAPRQAGRVRRVKREEVRSRLIEAAYGVFEERGYEGASLERVADAAGFSKGAVYSNFANKDELFFELVAARTDERIATIRAATAKVRARSRPAGAELSAAASAKFAGKLLREIADADPAWQILFIEFWLHCARNEDLRARFAEKRREMKAKIADYVEAQAACLGLRPSRAEAMELAMIALALSNGFGIEGIIEPKAFRSTLMGEILSRIVAFPSAPEAKSCIDSSSRVSNT